MSIQKGYRSLRPYGSGKREKEIGADRSALPLKAGEIYFPGIVTVKRASAYRGEVIVRFRHDRFIFAARRGNVLTM